MLPNSLKINLTVAADLWCQRMTEDPLYYHVSFFDIQAIVSANLVSNNQSTLVPSVSKIDLNILQSYDPPTNFRENLANTFIDTLKGIGINIINKRLKEGFDLSGILNGQLGTDVIMIDKLRVNLY